MWAGCQYGHNLEPHCLCLVHVIRDVMSGTLNKVVLSRILRVIHCVNVRPGCDPRKVWTSLTLKSSNVTLGSCRSDRFILMIAYSTSIVRIGNTFLNARHASSFGY